MLKTTKLAVYVAIAVLLSLPLVAFAQTSTDNFERSNGDPGANWITHPDLVIQNGNLHNQNTTNFDYLLGIYSGAGVVFNPTEATITWAGSDDGCNTYGVQWGGMAFLNAYSALADGYFIQVKVQEPQAIRLWYITDGALDGASIIQETPVSTVPAPGSDFKVVANAATHTFQVYADNVLMGTLQDVSGAVDISSTRYAGLMLTSSRINDIESFSVAISAVDGTAPAAITDLTADATGASTVLLEWSATGDDGASGQATAYDVRYSTSNIATENDFNSATQATGEPTPKVSGSAETFVVTGLTPETQYYFAIKARDEASNWSPLSNTTNATTDASGGSSGGDGELTTITDDFERTSLGSSWAATARHELVNGTLGIASGTSNNWNNLAVYNGNRATSPVGVSVMLDNTECDIAGARTVGLAVLLDSPSSMANGYFVVRRDNSLHLFSLVNGALSTEEAEDSNPDQPAPVPGDVIKVMVSYDEDLDLTLFDVYINEQLDGQLTLNGAMPATWYSGIVQHGAFNNNVESFSVIAAGGAAEMISEYYGNGQAGPIQTTLSDSIAVQVTDGFGTPAAGEVVEFDLVSGDATLSVDSYDYGGLIWSEVEDGTIVSPAITQSDGSASGGTYVKVPDPEETNPNYGQGGFSLNLYIPEAGSFRIWLRHIAPNGVSNSIYYSIDGSNDVEAGLDITANWKWQLLTTKALTKGFHQISIRTREEESRWDKMVLVDSNKRPGYTPTATGGTGPVLPNLTDANGVAYTFVTFGTNADDDVVIEASAFRSNGIDPLLGSPVTFTLDPISSNATTIIKDPAQADTLLGEPITQMVTPMRAFIRDNFGNGVAGVTVNWQVTEGNGTLQSSQTTSNALGAAENYLTLSAQNTPYTIQASVSGLVGSPVSFYVKPGDPPTTIERISPASQVTGQAGTELAELLNVRVKADDGSPFAGFPVLFIVTEGEGDLSTESGTEHASQLTVPTDENGYAKVKWTLGTTPGDNKVEARADGLTNSPIEFSAIGQVGEPATLTLVSGNNQSGPLGLPLQSPFVVRLTDSVGNLIANQNVQFQITQGTAAYLQTSGVTLSTVKTNAEGIAMDTLVIGNIVDQTHQVQVSVTGYTAVTPVIFNATSTSAIASEMEYVSGNGFKIGGKFQYLDAVVNSELSQDFIVKINGPFDNDPIANHAVLFEVVSGGGTFAGSKQRTVLTGQDGTAAARLTLGSQAGDSVNVVHATAYRSDIPSQELRNAPVVFKANGLPGTASRLVKEESVDEQSGTVGEPLEEQIKVKVWDAFNNPIQGHLVTFEVVNFGGSLQGTTGEPGQVKQVSTDAEGYASIIWIMPETPGQMQLEVRATSDGVNPLAGSPMTYTATSVVDGAYAMERVTGTDLSGTVANALPGNISVKILDQYGNPVPSYPVSFKVTAGDGLVNGRDQETVLTSSEGIAFVEWVLGNEKGFENNIVEATASLEVNSKITFKASGLSDVAYRLVPDSTYDTFGNVGELLSTPVKVRIVDQYGNPVSGQQVTFEIEEVNENAGYINTNGTQQLSLATNDDGYAQVNWGLGPMPGAQNNQLVVFSRRNNIHLINSPYDGFIASALAGNAHRVIKITNDTTQTLSSVHGSTLPEYLKVKVTDQFGNAIARHPVTFQVISRQVANGGTLDGMVDTVKTKETDSNGIASVQFTLGLNAGNKINKVQYTVEQDGQQLSGSPGVFEISGKSSTATSIVKISGDNQNNGTVGEFFTLPLQVAARDVNGNNVSGQPISFRILPKGDLADDELGVLGNGAATDTTINTNAQGIASIQWRAGHQVGLYQVEVTSFSETQLQGSPMTFSGTAFAQISDADESIITVDPDTLNVSDGSTRATVTVTLRDIFGNPVQNKGVTIQATDEGNTIIQPTSASDANGQVVGYISSRNSGMKSISARDINNEVDILNKAQVYFKAAAANKVVKIDDTDHQTRNAGTVLEHPLQVQVVDRFDNPIPAFTVNFNVTQARSGGQMVDGNNAVTDTNGIASGYYRLGTVTGSNQIEASAQGVSGSTVVFSAVGATPVALVKPVIASGDSQRVAPGQAIPSDLVVQVLDERGWPVWNQKVNYEALSTNDGQITSSNPHNTDWYGYARGKAQIGTKVGVNLFNATLTDYPEKGSVTFYAWTISASTAKYLTYVSGPASGTVGQTLGQPVIIKTTDEYGNPVQGINVTFVVISDASVDGAGTFSGGLTSITKVTDSQGQVSVFYTLSTQSGTNKIRVSALNLEPSTYDVVINARPDSPYSMAKWSGDNQYGEMGKHLFDPVYVRVYDRHGNPSPGGVVTFTVTQGDGYIDGNESVQSDANGLARAYWVLGPRPYATTNTLQVTSTYLIVQGGGSITFTAQGQDKNYPEFDDLPANLEVYETSTIDLPVSATDEDGDRIYFSAQNLPDGASFETVSETQYAFRWTPDLSVVTGENESKTFYPIFIAQDDQNPAGRVKDSVKVVVKNYNRPPVISNFWPISSYYKYDAQNNTPIQMGVSTSDDDGDPLTVIWYVGDTQVAEGHTFTLSPADYPQSSLYQVKVTVSDYFSTVDHTWTLDPTSVELASFSANAVPFKGVTIEWVTANESANAGFNILRGNTETGPFERINEALIESSPKGEYTFQDKDVKSGKVVYYKLQDVSYDGAINSHGPIKVESPVPTQFTLSQNYPNPFNPVTTIRYELPKHARVNIQVYNIMGQMVRELVDTQIEAGYHQVIWDGTNNVGMRVSSGVYYYRIIAGEFKAVKKMVLLK